MTSDNVVMGVAGEDLKIGDAVSLDQNGFLLKARAPTVNAAEQIIFEHTKGKWKMAKAVENTRAKYLRSLPKDELVYKLIDEEDRRRMLQDEAQKVVQDAGKMQADLTALRAELNVTKSLAKTLHSLLGAKL